MTGNGGPRPDPEREPATGRRPPGGDTAPSVRGDLEAIARQLHERIYSTLTMIAVLIGLAESGPVSHLDTVWASLGTAVGLWLATLVADQQAHRVVHKRMAHGAELRRMMWVSSPLLFSAVGPMIFVGLSALGAMSIHTALLTSVSVDLAELFAWGCVSGLRMGGGILAALVAGTADVVIGGAIVTVKVLAAH